MNTHPEENPMHVKVNRWLSTIALVLGIVIMAALIVGGIALIQKANQFGDAIDEIGTEEPATYEEPEETGLDEYYTGPFNPDGTPCEGYGCTPEQDEELLEAETEANN